MAKKLITTRKNLLTQIFRFFTQADVEVNNCYLRHYMTVFKPTEVLMMMTAFASMETVHVAAYSHLTRYNWNARVRIFSFHEV